MSPSVPGAFTFSLVKAYAGLELVLGSMAPSAVESDRDPGVLSLENWIGES